MRLSALRGHKQTKQRKSEHHTIYWIHLDAKLGFDTLNDTQLLSMKLELSASEKPAASIHSHWALLSNQHGKTIKSVGRLLRPQVQNAC